MKKKSKASSLALRFIILLGFVSLFADVTYEGARSIVGPYLALLGASAFIISTAAGAGEFFGYALRLLSGYLVDRTAWYWRITFVGYTLNLIAVPLLALTHHWQTAVTLLILERIGKAIRTPARDAMLSHAGNNIGVGWAFGLHEALDKIGAMTGPLLIASIFYFHDSYHLSFAILAIPALLALSLLTISSQLYPHPRDLEKINPKIGTQGFPIAFWIYLVATSCVAIGYVDFPLIAYHFVKADQIEAWWIPISYAMALGINGLTAPLLGRAFDHYGINMILIVTFISTWFAPLVFLGSFALSLFGIILWGIGMSGQQTLMRALIAKIIPRNKRASAYGLFNVCFGITWFAGSTAIGFLYEKSIMDVVTFSIFWQLMALPLLYLVKIKLK